MFVEILQISDLLAPSRRRMHPDLDDPVLGSCLLSRSRGRHSILRGHTKSLALACNLGDPVHLREPDIILPTSILEHTLGLLRQPDQFLLNYILVLAVLLCVCDVAFLFLIDGSNGFPIAITPAQDKG